MDIGVLSLVIYAAFFGGIIAAVGWLKYASRRRRRKALHGA